MRVLGQEDKPEQNKLVCFGRNGLLGLAYFSVQCFSIVKCSELLLNIVCDDIFCPVT